MLPQLRKSDNDSPARTPPSVLPPSMPSMSSMLGASASPLGSRPASAAFRPGSPAMTTVIGADLVIQGNLTSKGEIQIEGEVQGDIRATHVVLGERAVVTGGIVAEECVIRGHLLGTIRGRRVLLQSSAHVEGDIYHQTMAVEQGAYFEGKSRRTDDPLAGLALPISDPAEATPSADPAMPPPLS